MRVSAHLDMIAPLSRYGPDVLKNGPCGISGGERTDNVSYFEPGATIEVRWNEYVDHPSHYRIAFDVDGDDDFVDPSTMMEMYSNDAVLLDGIEDSASDPVYRVSVELPDVECDNCTLQLIQVMYDKPPYQVGSNDIYYQCADLVLKADPPPNPDPDPDPEPGLGGVGGTGSTPVLDDIDGDANANPAGGSSCAAASSSQTGAWLIGALMIVTARRLRRRLN